MKFDLSNIKKQLHEFFEFIHNQKIISLAIGFVLGGAVKNLVKALVEDIINPLISIFVGSTENLEIYIIKVGSIQIKWGAFLSELINFIIIAFIIFYTAKFLNIKTIEKKVKIK